MPESHNPHKVAAIVRPAITDDPANWTPLRLAVPRQWQDAFMWMGSAITPFGTIEMYKHGITRRYLNLDHCGRSYVFDLVDGSYTPSRRNRELGVLLLDLALLNIPPARKYDFGYIAERNRRLAALGYTILT